MKITEPGLYDEMSDEDYHGDPVPEGSLSSTGARRLLPPNPPALFAYERENPRESTETLDFGKAAHARVLGTGPELVVVEGEWRSKDAKAAVAEVRERGAIPLHEDQYDAILGMENALREHPIASALLDPAHGKAEQSGFWRDEEAEIWRRFRLDWLPDPSDGRLIVPDYKTTRSATNDAFGKAAADYGYHCQDAWYLDGIRALGLAEDVAFVFIVQEKVAPYLVNVVQLNEEARQAGRRLNRMALDIYAKCTAANHWPGYEDVTYAALPGWYLNRIDELGATA